MDFNDRLARQNHVKKNVFIVVWGDGTVARNPPALKTHELYDAEYIVFRREDGQLEVHKDRHGDTRVIVTSSRAEHDARARSTAINAAIASRR